MVIYTKRGDKGETSLYDPQNAQNIRISKTSAKISAIGAIDELNSFLGITKANVVDKMTVRQMGEIQKDLLTIGSILAGSGLRFSSTKTKRLEKIIDKLEGTLPVLKNFIIPGGSLGASYLQYARTLARKTERAVVAISEVTSVKPQILSYLNRLSDYLFMLARQENHNQGIKEKIWKGRKR